MSSKFVHLHTHSHYSLLDGLTKLEDMVDIAKKNGQTAVALTDHGNMYGAIEFYKVARKAGIKPIIGVEAYVTSGSRLDKVAVSNGKRYYHLILLAKNLQGYKNLIRLVTIANLEGYYYKPRMDKEILRKYHEGIVCLSACLGGELSQAVLANDMDKADDIVREHLDIFGKENYFIEVQSHPHIENDKLVRERLIALARKHDVTIVATQDSHYPCRDDHEAHHTLLAINTQGDGNTGKFEFPDDDFSLIDEKTALEYFADIPEAVANTSKVADLCENYEIELGVAYFPEFPLPEGITADMKLRELSYEGFAFRDLEQTKPYLDRLEYELSVIKQKGYAGYFLVVGDLLKFARENGILTNIRGSVAGSLTTYLIGITNVDPLVYKLPFERFLNPERPSLPDIDMDYADNRRGEMIEYAKRRYGEDRVAQIGTFGTMMAKGSVRDVARALGYPYAIGDRISSLIPMGSQGFPMTIKHAMELIPELADAYKKEADTKRIIDLALKLEGCVRHVSVHAAGVVIAPKPLYEFAPVQYDPKGGSIITQYDMHYIEDVGLPKFDFLGIRNLAILADAVRLVKELRNVDVNLDKVPLEDARTFEILARGETMGLFQLNGSGMTAYLKQLKPTTIHDINAMVALYRPGPMEMIPEYIQRKENPALVRYLDPRMKDILDQSYGVITYQDDVMMIAIKLAGYSWLEADKLRKAMGKKIPAEMEAQKKHLLDGFVEHGLSEKKAQELWTLIEPFAAYGFNKCLVGDTLITHATTGERMTIEDLYIHNRTASIHSMNDSLKLESREVQAVMENGIKDVYTLRTRTGREITATGNHPFYTFAGWRDLSELAEGTKIAVARRAPSGTIREETYKAVTLGYLIAEGNLCRPHGVYYYSKAEDEINDFIAHAQQFENASISIDRSKSAASVYIGQLDKKKGNTLRSWLTSLDLVGKTATHKQIPSWVYTLDNTTLAIFLGKLWQGDGCVSIQNVQVFYATSSKRLAHDVQHLLLRFSIISTIYTKTFKYRGSHKIGYTVVISHRDNLIRFAETIGTHLIGKKKTDLETLATSCREIQNHGIVARGTPDTVPALILPIIRKEMSSHGITVSALAGRTALAPRMFGYDAKKIGYQRESIRRIGQALNSSEILSHADSDIYWDEVVSITPAGRRMTYDLTVAPHHNFVANDIIVHNSHAASYGRVAYQTAYMKANFPVEYLCAILTAESGDTEKVAEIINEAVKMGITVLPPEINASFADFTVVNNSNVPGEGIIRFGLLTIKNFGADIANAIIEERRLRGDFKSVTEFLERITHKNLNKKSMEALIKAGAFDHFGERGQLLANMEVMLAYNKERQNIGSQVSLFGDLPTQSLSLTLAPAPKAETIEKLKWEKELLGLYVSGHPLERIRDRIEKSGMTIKKIRDEVKPGFPVTFACIVEEVKVIFTKKNEQMAFVKVGDLTSSIEGVLFTKPFAELQNILLVDTVVAVQARVSERNGEKSLIIEKAKAV